MSVVYQEYYVNRTEIFQVMGIKGVMDIEDAFILYNPDNNYWLQTDSYGKELFECVKEKKEATKIYQYFKDKYDMDEETFNDNVKEILDCFVKKDLISLRRNEEPTWMQFTPPLSEIDKYPFNDIYISLCDDCNLNCIYCFNKNNRVGRNRKGTSRLSVEKIVEVLSEFKRLGGKRVVFTGGEPTLNADLLSIIEETYKIGLEQHLITNGILLERLDFQKITGYLTQIDISIDTVNINEAAFLWGETDVEKMFNSLMNGLKKLNDFLLEKKDNLLRITIMPVVTSVNKDSILELIDLIQGVFFRQISWKFTKYGEIGIKNIDEKLRISDAEYLNLLKSIARETGKCTDEKATAYAITHCGERSIREKPILALCCPSFFVTNHGDVYPCQGLEKSEYYLGSVYEKTLEELFFSEVFSDVRKNLYPSKIEKCRDCSFRFICTERCSLCNIECKEESCKEAMVRKLFVKISGY